MFDRVG
jgi:hypothetical protein